MPALIVSSRYSTDSQQLRQAAQKLGWETLRLDGAQIPEWFELPDDRLALFYTAPHVFDLAAQFSRTLLGCQPAWTVELPSRFRLREIRQMTLSEALELSGESFVKHSVSKAFPAAVYHSQSLAEATSRIHPQALVHVAEPVAWTVEYRCFVLDRSIMAISPYRRHGRVFDDLSNLLDAPPEEIEAAAGFARSVLESPAVASPPAFVLDVGIIEGRGWAVVEPNECWAAGIYACDPQAVLTTLLRACVPLEAMSKDERWDFRQHYFAASP